VHNYVIEKFRVSGEKILPTTVFALEQSGSQGIGKSQQIQGWKM